MELVGFANRTFCHHREDDKADKPREKDDSIHAASTAEVGRGESTTGVSAAPLTATTTSAATKTSAATTASSESHRLELTADFHRLNILLMRIDKNTSSRSASATGKGLESAFMSLSDYPRQEAHKVATLTLAQARIQASYGQESSSVEGSLGGLNLCDLTPACGR